VRIHESSRSRHRGNPLLPLEKASEPNIGDFCRGVVVGKDEAKKELVLHLTYLVE
jgi:hypothetical protein